MSSFDGFACYIPVHTNYAQMENIAVFLDHMAGKLFMYEWNTEREKMTDEFGDAARWPRAEVLRFTEEEVFRQLVRDEQAGRRVVVVLTASTNYPFARSQLRFFRTLQKLFPSTLIDVLPLGHCMYGCDSCSVKEHQIPLFFTRYCTKSLPYSKEDLSTKYELAAARTTGKKIVLIAPSVYDKSFLTQRPFIEALIKLQSNESDKFKFLVKLHGYCFFTYKQEANGDVTSHPLHSLSDVERENVQLLKENFVVADETEYNVLPFIEAADVVFTDLDSSVAFEALYFQAAILAFDNRSQSDEDPDDEEKAEYHSYLHLFKTIDQLNSLLHSHLKPKHGTKGKQFFEKKYGQVSGKEMDRIAESRGWFVPPAEAIAGHPEDRWAALQSKISAEFDEASSTPLDYMARGCEIPANVLDFTLFLQAHQQQLQDMRVPESLWRKLHNKVKNETFDSGRYFQFGMDEDGNMLLILSDELEEGLPADSDIFLVDHFWTSTIENTRKQLRTVPNLLERMSAIVGVSPEGIESKEELVDKVWKNMWKFNQTYRVRLNDEDKEGTPVWYMMDELGSRVSHCDTPQEEDGSDVEEDDEVARPNTRCVPFFYNARGISYSLLWPVTDIEPGDIITRDFLEGVKGSLQRAARGVAFGIEEGDEYADLFKQALERHRTSIQSVVPPSRPPPLQVSGGQISGSQNTPLKIFSDTEFVKKALTWERFAVVENVQDADVLWFSDDVGNIQYLLRDEKQLVNQYPNETCVTYKHKLVETILRCWGETCTWLPITYNLNSQLPQFIAHWREIEEKGYQEKEDNLWIVKPWNKSRGLEIFVADSLAPFIRSIETGPKIVSKYLSRPALYKGRKFDLRYIIMVRSLEPLELYAYRMFWIRAANKPFSLDHLDDYETHFTVMNYSTFQLEQVLYTDFIKTFEEEHPSVQWDSIQRKIYEMFRDVFVAAVQPSTDKWEGILPRGREDGTRDLRQQCRGMYGADLMIDEHMNPVLLEMNFSPDCQRAVDYDPDFFNVVFTLLFTDDWKEDSTPKQMVMSKVALI